MDLAFAANWIQQKLVIARLDSGSVSKVRKSRYSLLQPNFLPSVFEKCSCTQLTLRRGKSSRGIPVTKAVKAVLQTTVQMLSLPVLHLPEHPTNKKLHTSLLDIHTTAAHNSGMS